MADPFQEAAEAAVLLVEQVTDFDRAAIGSWSIGGLVGHMTRALLTPAAYMAEPAPGAVDLQDAAAYIAAYLQRRHQDPGLDAAVAARGTAAAATDAGAIKRAHADLLVALDAVPAGRIVATPFGSIRLEDYLRTRTMELVVHSLDLANAIDVEWEPPASALRDVLSLLGEIAMATGRGSQVVLALSGRTVLEGPVVQ